MPIKTSCVEDRSAAQELESAAAIQAEVVCLTRRIDYYPIVVSPRIVWVYILPALGSRATRRCSGSRRRTVASGVSLRQTVMVDGLGQPGTIGSCLGGQRGSRTSAPPPRSQSNSRLPALECTSFPAPGIPASRRSTPPILRARSPVARDRPSQRGSLLQDWIEDCLRHLSFHG